MFQLSPLNAQYIKNQKSSSKAKASILNKSDINQNIQNPTFKERATAIGISFAIIGVIAGTMLLAKRLMIPAKYKELFKSLNKINDFEEFVQSAYKGIVKCENMQNIAPEKVDIVDEINRDSGACGGYNLIENSISVNVKIKKDSRFAIFNTLRHELEHCKQHNWMLRCLGKDKYLEWQTKDHPFLSPKYNDKFTQRLRKSFQDRLEKGFSYSLSQPELELTSEKELDRLCQYMSSKGITSEKYGMLYAESPIEKEAYKAGSKAESWYRVFNFGLHSSLN